MRKYLLLGLVLVGAATFFLTGAIRCRWFHFAPLPDMRTERRPCKSRFDRGFPWGMRFYGNARAGIHGGS